MRFNGLTYRWTIKLFKNPPTFKRMEPMMQMVLKLKTSYSLERLEVSEVAKGVACHNKGDMCIMSTRA